MRLSMKSPYKFIFIVRNIFLEGQSYTRTVSHLSELGTEGTIKIYILTSFFFLIDGVVIAAECTATI